MQGEGQRREEEGKKEILVDVMFGQYTEKEQPGQTEGSFSHLTEPVGLGAVPRGGFPPSSEMEFDKWHSTNN